jgi:hypothetical protein
MNGVWLTLEHCWRMECGLMWLQPIAETKRCEAFKKRSKCVGEGSQDMPRRRLRPLCPLSSGMPI